MFVGWRAVGLVLVSLVSVSVLVMVIPNRLVSPAPPQAPLFATYYVDSETGNDANDCAAAQNPATPKKTVSGVLQCNPGAGETVRFRGVFQETIVPPRSGQVLYEAQDIHSVAENKVAFAMSPQGLVPDVDYVAIYGSRMGNSGAFPVVAVKGNTVTVDTSALPGGAFVAESEEDPGTLQAAILRPVHYTAWDRNDIPLWRTAQQTFHSHNREAIMVSYLHSDSIGGDQGVFVWPAFEIDGSEGGSADYHILDHLEIEHAETGIATEFSDFHANYAIIQHCNIHHIGYPGGASDEIIYWGNSYQPDRHHDFCQIMYNRVGPHNTYEVSNDPQAIFVGDGIELKPSAHNCTVFGNEVVGTNAIMACDDAPIRVSGANAFISNNYIHDIFPQPDDVKGCGISILTDPELGDAGGPQGAIVANNIVANVKQTGIRVLDTDDVQILNNVVYNIFPRINCEHCQEETVGILIDNYVNSTEGIVIRNNIVHTALTGIGRYRWPREQPFSVTSDHNIVFNSDLPFGRDILATGTDLTADPGLVDPANANFAIRDDSIARDTGYNMSHTLLTDNHNAITPAHPPLLAVVARGGTWDRGAYELAEEPQVEEGEADDREWVTVALGVSMLATVMVSLVIVLRRRR
ncbi:MAG: hypothetical protein GYB65_08175 [Chloroflexi bacterium]|nr:hypothetical protein [Chloroflexota bacterium]